MTNESTFDVPALIEMMQREMGINPFTIYCQLTGKPIGRIDSDELEPFLHGDIEEVADNLFVRIIASMRPSIHWNRMREDSLDKMATARPIETLAYLLNRLFQPVEFYKLPLAKRLDNQHERIRLYRFLVDMQPAVRESLYAQLIEIDAKMNLSQQQIDLRPSDFMLFLDESLKTLDAFHADCMKRWAKSQKLEEDSRRWFKGNTIAKPAFFRSFMEAKPETKAAATKRVKKEQDAALDALFDTVMAEAEAAPVPTPTIPAEKPKSHAGKVPAFLIRSK